MADTDAPVTDEELEVFARSEHEHCHRYCGGNAKLQRERVGSKADQFFGDRAARKAHAERLERERAVVDRRSLAEAAAGEPPAEQPQDEDGA